MAVLSTHLLPTIEGLIFSSVTVGERHSIWGLCVCYINSMFDVAGLKRVVCRLSSFSSRVNYFMGSILLFVSKLPLVRS